MTGSTLNVAVVGAGYFARFHYDAWRRHPSAQLVATADRLIDKAEAIAREFSIPRSFADPIAMLDAVRPDVLDIAVQPVSHLALITAAAERGIAVVCQKPFCETLAQARRAVEIADRASVALIVHENFRFQPWHVAARQWVQDGRLGEVYQATFRIRPGDGQGPRAYLDRQPYFQEMPRFLVRETAVHVVDVMRAMLGEVTAVYADLRRLNPAIKGEDAGLAVLEFANGARGLIDGNRLSDHQARDRRYTIGEMIIEGSKGTLRLTGDGDLRWRPFGTNQEESVAYPRGADRGFAGDSVMATIAAAVDGLTGDQPIVNSGKDYLANLEIEQAIYRSSAEGRRLSLKAAGSNPEGTTGAGP